MSLPFRFFFFLSLSSGILQVLFFSLQFAVQQEQYNVTSRHLQFLKSSRDARLFTSRSFSHFPRGIVIVSRAPRQISGFNHNRSKSHQIHCPLMRRSPGAPDFPELLGLKHWHWTIILEHGAVQIQIPQSPGLAVFRRQSTCQYPSVPYRNEQYCFFVLFFSCHRFLVLTKVTTLTEQTFSVQDLDDGKAHRYIIFTISHGIFNFF